MFFSKQRSNPTPETQEDSNNIYVLAAKNNTIGVMERIVKGAEVNSRVDTVFHGTALLAAVFIRNESLVRLLLLEGADPSVKNDQGVSPFGQSQRDVELNPGDKIIININKMLLARTNKEKIDPQFEDILLYASISAYDRVKYWVLEQKRFNDENKKGLILSYLLKSAIENKGDVLKKWHKAEGDEKGAKIGPSHLIDAVTSGCVEATTYLLAQGIDPDANDGMALEIAYKRTKAHGEKKILDILLAAEAKGPIYFRFASPVTNQEHLAILEELEFLEDIKDVECTQFLIERALTFAGKDKNQHLQSELHHLEEKLLLYINEKNNHNEMGIINQNGQI